LNKPVTTDEETSGECWHTMLRNPVIVSGYPILTKNKPGLGLEMLLNMMAWLNGSNKATEFDGKIFIKGFSTILVATRRSNDLLLWHYYYSNQEERTSYLDSAIESSHRLLALTWAS
jgi:hypothetical protein